MNLHQILGILCFVVFQVSPFPERVNDKNTAGSQRHRRDTDDTGISLSESNKSPLGDSPDTKISDVASLKNSPENPSINSASSNDAQNIVSADVTSSNDAQDTPSTNTESLIGTQDTLSTNAEALKNAQDTLSSNAESLNNAQDTLSKDALNNPQDTPSTNAESLNNAQDTLSTNAESLKNTQNTGSTDTSSEVTSVKISDLKSDISSKSDNIQSTVTKTSEDAPAILSSDDGNKTPSLNNAQDTPSTNAESLNNAQDTLSTNAKSLKNTQNTGSTDTSSEVTSVKISDLKSDISSKSDNIQSTDTKTSEDAPAILSSDDGNKTPSLNNEQDTPQNIGEAFKKTPNLGSTDTSSEDTSLKIDDVKFGISSISDNIDDADGSVGMTFLSNGDDEIKDRIDILRTGSDIETVRTGGTSAGVDNVKKEDTSAGVETFKKEDTIVGVRNDKKGDTSAGVDSDDKSVGVDDDIRKGVIGFYSVGDDDFEGRDDEMSYGSTFYGGSGYTKPRRTLSRRLQKGLTSFRRDLAEGKLKETYADNIDECITNVISLLVSLEVKHSRTTTITTNTTIHHEAPLRCTFDNIRTPCFLKSSTSDLQWKTAASLKLKTKSAEDDDDDDRENYLYVDRSQKQYGFATLETTFGPLFPKKPRCMSFYYQMKGENPGSLTVLALDERRNELLLFEAKGEQGSAWKYAKLDVPALDGLKLVIEAETMAGPSSDIAIDDITLSSGTCDGVNQPYEITVSICDSMPCLNGATCLDNDKTFTCICAPGWAGVTCSTALFIRRCSFETETCFFKNVDKGDKFDWTRNKGETESKKTGPFKAYRGDYYMYAEASKPQRRGHIARLRTDKISPVAERCLSFWYSMRGKGMGTLRVLAKGENKTAIVLWEKSGDQKKSWHKTNLIDVPELEGLVLNIEMIRGWNWTSDAAIDDIVLAPGKCFAPREVTCRDGNPCHNRGVCSDTFSCDCASDWTGKNCQKKLLPCDSNPCQNAGTCYNVGNVYQCGCRSGFTGIDCEVREPGNQCVNNCGGLPNGNYQSCRSCEEYVACSNSSPIYMNCPSNLIWDDELKTCERKSNTCD